MTGQTTIYRPVARECVPRQHCGQTLSPDWDTHLHGKDLQQGPLFQSSATFNKHQLGTKYLTQGLWDDPNQIQTTADGDQEKPHQDD